MKKPHFYQARGVWWFFLPKDAERAERHINVAQVHWIDDGTSVVLLAPHLNVQDKGAVLAVLDGEAADIWRRGMQPSFVN